MSTNTSIEWTDKTWGVVRGCSVISDGCHNCYAMKQAHRFSGPGKPYEGLTKQTARSGPQWTGKVVTVEKALLEPLSWRKPARVFVNSMSDLFHEDVPDEFIDRVFGVMAFAERHTFQVLTKRPNRMRWWMNRFEERHPNQRNIVLPLATDSIVIPREQWPLRNVWLGVSVENPPFLNRIDELLNTPAAVRFVSLEPLLADLGDISRYFGEHRARVGNGINWRGRGLDWVIVGGESGPQARPFDLAWARSIVQQCKAAGVPVFVKQLGRWPLSHQNENEHGGRYWVALYKKRGGVGPTGEYGLENAGRSKGGDPSEWPADLRIREFPTEVRA